MRRSSKVRGIYILTSPSGKRYIGKAEDMGRRFRGHRSGSMVTGVSGGRCPVVAAAIQKYGWDSMERTIIPVDSGIDLGPIEQFFIGLFQSNQRQFGYNLTSGGERGFTINLESREKMRASALARDLRGANNPNYGKRWPADRRAALSTLQRNLTKRPGHRAKMSAALKGLNAGPNASNWVDVDKEKLGQLIRQDLTAEEIGLVLGVKPFMVIRRCKRFWGVGIRQLRRQFGLSFWTSSARKRIASTLSKQPGRKHAPEAIERMKDIKRNWWAQKKSIAA